MIRPGRKQTNWQPHGYQGFGFFIHGLWSGSPPDTRGRSPVRKSRTPGSVRGVSGNGYPYRDIGYYLTLTGQNAAGNRMVPSSYKAYPPGQPQSNAVVNILYPRIALSAAYMGSEVQPCEKPR